MAANVGINFVRIFFYEGNKISQQRKRALVALAYATARAQVLAPKAILIRSDLHCTTRVEGKYIQDPKGWHGTFAFKCEDHMEQEFHVTSHGYTSGKEDFVLTEAVHTQGKPDSTLKGGGKPVWPNEKKLEEYVDSPIGYSHLSENK